MRKLDKLTPVGLMVGVIMIIFGIVASGGWTGVKYFFDFSSIFIVIGGIVAGLFISFQMKDLRKTFIVMKKGFSKEERSIESLIETFVKLADRARREGILSLELEVVNEPNPFIRKGVLLAVDGIEPEMIRDILDADIDAMEERHRKGRNIIEKAGDYAPAWGMIGTLIGLVLMLKNMDDPSELGSGMAIALLTTLYGSLLANLFFNPLAAKLESQTDDEIFYKQVVIEGVIGVQTGQNPTILREKLSVYLSETEKKSIEERLELTEDFEHEAQ
ncbi:flagellar motor protein MotP [Cytobacillus kochii]|uniref:Motility protein A n=1 Tax=Cytobacillus kochii TaxID=859143 RepID=A0A248TKH3_9BACI|nr:flagellar motor protein MotP [Cytobacillus kochii]ASV68661.1 motility protein A [Cytobacillus kochii]MDQ0186199.1 chemotaxis protein MotA [Cytobacillus kochii]